MRYSFCYLFLVWANENTLWPFAYFIRCYFVLLSNPWTLFWHYEALRVDFHSLFMLLYFFLLARGRFLFVLYGSFYINYKFIRRDIFILDFRKQIPSIKIINCMVKLDISVHLYVVVFFLVCDMILLYTHRTLQFLSQQKRRRKKHKMYKKDLKWYGTHEKDIRTYQYLHYLNSCTWCKLKTYIAFMLIQLDFIKYSEKTTIKFAIDFSDSVCAFTLSLLSANVM